MTIVCVVVVHSPSWCVMCSSRSRSLFKVAISLVRLLLLPVSPSSLKSSSFASAMYLWTFSVRLYADQSLYSSRLSGARWREELRVWIVISWKRLLRSRGSTTTILRHWDWWNVLYLVMLKDILRSAAAPLLKVILLSVECWLRRNDFVLSREGEEFSWEPTPAYPYPLLNMYPPILVIISCFVSFVIKAAQRRKCVRSQHYSSCVAGFPFAKHLNLKTTCPWMSLPHCLSFIDEVSRNLWHNLVPWPGSQHTHRLDPRLRRRWSPSTAWPKVSSKARGREVLGPASGYNFPQGGSSRGLTGITRKEQPGAECVWFYSFCTSLKIKKGCVKVKVHWKKYWGGLNGDWMCVNAVGVLNQRVGWSKYIPTDWQLRDIGV